MTFVQLVECRTSEADRFNRLMDAWVQATEGKRTATHSMIGRDTADAHHLVEIVTFPSREQAQRNADLPETNEIYEQMVALCDEPPSFTDLEIIRDQPL